MVPGGGLFEFALLVNIKDKKEGTFILTYNTDKAMGFEASGGGAGCEDYYWDTIGVNLSIE